jgi:hypothetical protein
MALLPAELSATTLPETVTLKLLVVSMLPPVVVETPLAEIVLIWLTALNAAVNACWAPLALEKLAGIVAPLTVLIAIPSV